MTCCDPIYEFSASEIASRIDETIPKILSSTRRKLENFSSAQFGSPQRLAQFGRATMQEFLNDFPSGPAQSRYRAAELANLPFCGDEFDIALCSHFLFTYSNLLDLTFHLDSIRELCRVAGEVRIRPLVPQFGAGHSGWLRKVLDQLTQSGDQCEVKRVPYEFQ